MARATATNGAKRGSGSSRIVRASRDGDRFHYVWAASRLLHLLDPSTRLLQLTVEGTGATVGEAEPKGSEVIDIIEFYGDQNGVVSELVVTQFKHSTLNSTTPLGIAEVGDIIAKFALLDNSSGDLRASHPGAEIHFAIITNRPV